MVFRVAKRRKEGSTRFGSGAHPHMWTRLGVSQAIAELEDGGILRLATHRQLGAHLCQLRSLGLRPPVHARHQEPDRCRDGKDGYK